MATIVLAEDEFSQAMVDFAAALTHRGHHTIRLLADTATDIDANPSRRRWESLATQWVPGAVATGGALTPRGMVVLEVAKPDDVQAMEPIATWMSHTGRDRLQGWAKSTVLPDAEIIDKLALTQWLRDNAMAVPRSWDGLADVPVDYPGPLVVKLRDSGGGNGVQLVESRADLAGLLDQPGRLGGASDSGCFVQEFRPGATVVAAGVATAGEVLSVMAYEITVDPKRPFAFGYGLTVRHDPDAIAYARAIIEQLGISGPFAMDIVRGEGGEPMLIDLNIRIWGSWTGCQAVGLDVLGAYECALGVGPRPAPTRLPPPGTYQPLVRTPPLGVAGAKPRMAWLGAELRMIGQWSHWLGRPWARTAGRRAIGWASGPLRTLGR